MKKQRYSETLKRVLILVILISMGIIVAIFVSSRQRLDKSDEPVSTVQNKANISLNKVYQTSTKDGKEEWSLEAISARYLNEEKRAIFEKPAVVFFLKNDQHVHLTAEEGILKTDSNDIEVKGNVVVKNSDYKIETENLYYRNDKQILSTSKRVKISGTGFHFVADSISFDLNTNKTILKGSVKGVFSKKVSL